MTHNARTQQIQTLERGEVDPAELAVEVRSSKPLEAYTQSTRSVAALERAEATGIERAPGQSITYVVVDDSKSGRERVQLPHEAPETYDPSFYADEVVRAAESVVSPLGWRADKIEDYLSDRVATSIQAFG